MASDSLLGCPYLGMGRWEHMLEVVGAVQKEVLVARATVKSEAKAAVAVVAEEEAWLAAG